MVAKQNAKRNPCAGTRRIAEVFETQIQTILKNQESITHDYEMNAPATRKRSRGPQYENVDSAVYDWYALARQRLVPVTAARGSTNPCKQYKESMISKHLMVGFKNLRTETTLNSLW